MVLDTDRDFKRWGDMILVTFAMKLGLTLCTKLVVSYVAHIHDISIMNSGVT